MGRNRFAAIIFVSLSVLPFAQANAKALTTLTVFTNTDGAHPMGNLLADSAGNLYGTTSSGGAQTCGTVFELLRPARGMKDWSEIVLTSFTGRNGDEPMAGMIADKSGNFYGTTLTGGIGGSGAVFELTPPVAGQTAWTETALVSFDGTDGARPEGSLLFDGAGNLYGTTSRGGAADDGTVFMLMPPVAGQTAWTETVLFSFAGNDGSNPAGNLIADGTGSFYGTTEFGGASGFGTVFKLTPPAPGNTTWTETVLVAFNGTNGKGPYGGLIADKAGNLYGTTILGGAFGQGAVFELSPPAGGQTAWTETVIASLSGPYAPAPAGNLLFDKAGNLYGTTQAGGTKGFGSVFKLTPPVQGQTAWTETVLASLTKTTGNDPIGGLIADKAGHLYGTARGAGHNPGRYGSVFEVKP